MSCDECRTWTYECGDCIAERERAKAREEGRREGYAACTADVDSFMDANLHLGAVQIMASIQRGEHVGAAGKGKL